MRPATSVDPAAGEAAVATAPLLLAPHLALAGDGSATAVVVPLSQRVRARARWAPAGDAAPTPFGPPDPPVRVAYHGFWTPPAATAPGSALHAAAAAVARAAAAAGTAPAAAALEVAVAIPAPPQAGLAAVDAAVAAALVAADAAAGTRLGAAGLARLAGAAAVAGGAPLAGVALAGSAALARLPRLAPGEPAEPARHSPVLDRGAVHWVLSLVNEDPGRDAVLATLARIRAARAVPRAGDPGPLLRALAAGDAAAAAAAMGNDLAPATVSLLPRLRRTLKAGADLGALAGIVCGAGSAVALAWPDRAAALDAAAQLATTGAGAWTLAAAQAGPGARLEPVR